MTESCSIDLVTAEDLPLLLGWRNHPKIRQFMLTQHIIEMDEHQQWFDQASRDPDRHLLLVRHVDYPIGYVQFSGALACGVADWGFYTNPDGPKGCGRKLGETALRYAFGPMQLHKVCGQVIDSNYASVLFHERLGFTREGVLREQKHINRQYHSLICFGLLASEWPA
jgi:UDP-4-amino-4,6-dideoxy-N-acetyl-beta-L-altrosamine N-acetyltransferase